MCCWLVVVLLFSCWLIGVVLCVGWGVVYGEENGNWLWLNVCGVWGNDYFW